MVIEIQIDERVYTAFCEEYIVFSVLFCPWISNVPSAILLFQFTMNYQELLVGVNIGTNTTQHSLREFKASKIIFISKTGF